MRTWPDLLIFARWGRESAGMTRPWPIPVITLAVPL
jgi:hypothetical protein